MTSHATKVDGDVDTESISPIFRLVVYLPALFHIFFRDCDEIKARSKIKRYKLLVAQTVRVYCNRLDYRQPLSQHVRFFPALELSPENSRLLADSFGESTLEYRQKEEGRGSGVTQ